jgi:hypothetical protein
VVAFFGQFFEEYRSGGIFGLPMYFTEKVYFDKK